VALLAFVCLPPLLSHDVYSYIDYARLDRLHDLNPYLFPPDSAKGDPAFAHVTWKNTASTYGPLFTLASYPLAWIPVGAAVYALKAAAAAAVLAAAGVVARLAPGRGVDPLRAAAFVALNPLVLVHVVGGPHNDAFVALLMTLGFAGVLTARETSAGGAFLAAVAVKVSAAVAIPFALLATPERRRAGRLLFGAVVAGAVLASLAFPAFGDGWLNSLTLVGESQDRTSYMSIPITAARLTGLDPDATRPAAGILYAALIAYLLAWTYRGGDWIRGAAWATTALLLATAWLMPWYLLWPLPATALSRDRALQLLVLGLTAYQLGARIPL
jgi:alpha-1,6-mannosyltransferase